MMQSFVTIDVVAARLGVSVPTARLWCKTGKIPPTTYLRVGRTYRFDLDKLMSELQANTVATATAPAANTPQMEPLLTEPNPDKDI